MKKLILAAALIIISLQGNLFAQSYISKQMSKTNTDLTFNINQGQVSIRDFVTLKQGRMVLELTNLTDYENFRNLDSLLTLFKKDIAFYKDSLAADPTAHVRIDYVINSDYSFKKIRFKKYAADGNIFMNQEGEISKLKFEQDTINIIIQKSIPGTGRQKAPPCTIAYAIRASFALGNYYDIDRIIADKVLAGIVDTLDKTTRSKKIQNKYFEDAVTINYNPYYNGKGALRAYDGLFNDEYDHTGVSRKKNKFTVNASFGAGVVHNTLTPMADIGVQYSKYWNPNRQDHNIFRLSASPNYFFDKDEKGNFKVNDNWFVNIELGSIYSTDAPGWFGKECTIGLGYLAYEQGGYFKNTTCKVFTDLQLTSWVTLAPEVIFTNNFKQFFPGLTLKVF